MLQMEVYIYCKTLSNRMNSKSAFKNQKLKVFCLIARENHSKTIKVIKYWTLLNIKYWILNITGMAKGIAIVHKNRCLLVKYRDHHWSQWLVDSKPFLKNLEKGCGSFTRLLEQLFRIASKFWVCFNANSTFRAVTYEVFKALNDLNSNFMK